MPQRKEEFINNEIYHITTRRIGDEILFENIDDYYRGIFSIYEFNNANPVAIQKRRRKIQEIKRKFRNGRGRASTAFVIPDERNKLVEILTFSFMPNHIHLLLRQLEDGGITKFMSKVQTGYAAYFKQKHEIKRKGYFFQGRFNSVRIETTEQLRTVFVYIHANPISLIEPKWKELGIKNPKKAIKFLEEEYKWSSCLDYIGKKNFSSVTERDFMLKVMGGEQGCRDFIENWIEYKSKIRETGEGGPRPL
ncbi:MAG: hypothetical protein COX37_01235 [Candidatus Nealsonbacteria bacterium CG23_combo_of_CG06-09_8_20_14_all_39_17]|uniref:Transposase IS200-like domain-containing protein n=1 Tax=Candidatus Nealsonbacteria bacterium CG23_combo_of_CG06-09_8_20_14_all_39_17 TaxID=1974722 RepID=A0A2G9YUN4_9BACT|nr:MAG: hypothetical protein COX37_01235 [Candidatus Nealsonbacteria bacterium CG23_combo_of_CG06-09_8_20_14_all_39_17]PIU43799.1 MAG: hypothetical protein COS96_02475 [Candidatus Nealsonbacteria bacterium CG07_land_8_20_14_0_80_39_13]